MTKELDLLKCLHCGQPYRLDEYSQKKRLACSGCGMETVPLIAGKISERDTKGLCVLLGFFTITALLGSLGGIMMVHGWNFWVTFAIIGGIIFFVGKIFMGKYRIKVITGLSSKECVTNFDRLVIDAINELPQDLKDRLSNVSVVVEDKPSSSVLGKLRLMPNVTLMGLFQGIPLNKKSVWHSGTLPEKITIYQKNIEALCRSEEEIKRRTKNVVRHEVAHFAGFTEEEIKGMGY
ncbi:MAG: metallopeptidase family protein [Planctomycetes bacterium]|nr:metallopeptidase family protein [Planctomycetota bacterium]